MRQSRLHGRIARQRRIDFFDGVVEREVTAKRRGAALRDPEHIPSLLDVNRQGTHDARVPAAQPLPVEDLSAIERQVEVEFPGQRDGFEVGHSESGRRTHPGRVPGGSGPSG